MNFILSLIITLVIVHLRAVIPLRNTGGQFAIPVRGHPSLCGGAYIFDRDDLAGHLMGQVSGSFPDPHHGGTAEITALDQGQ